MPTSFLSVLDKFIGQIPTNSVLRERATFLKEQAEELERRLARVEEENRELREQLEECQAQVARLKPEEEFFEHRGALFKRKVDGSWDKVVYCPNCRQSTSALEPFMPFRCANCHWLSPFKGQDLEQVMSELP